MIQTFPEFTGFARRVTASGRYNFNGVGEHIGLPDLADHLHEHLLGFEDVVDVVHCESAVREDHAAEQGLQIRMVEDGNIGKGALVDAQERLVEPVDKLLELLAEVVVRILHVVSALHVLFPEIPRPDEDVRHAYCRRRPVFPRGLTIFCHGLKPWCPSFHPRINSGCTLLNGDSRYRLSSAIMLAKRVDIPVPTVTLCIAVIYVIYSLKVDPVTLGNLVAGHLTVHQ